MSSERISDNLDYSIDNIDDRLSLVNKLVGGYNDGLIGDYDDYLVDYYDNHYNPHINQAGFTSESSRVGKDLELLADYLLYAKDQDSEGLITDYREKRNNRKESSIDKVLKVKDFTNETNKSIIKIPKIKVTKKDRLEYKELKETGEGIKKVTEMINSGVDSKGNDLPVSEIRKLKWIRTDMQKDEVVMKAELKKYISFNSITKPEPDYQALSYIRFDDAEIIRLLIEHYSEYKQMSFDDTFGYMKLIMFVFEDLVDSTDMEDYIKDILIWKIDKLHYDDIIEKIKDKYDMKITKPKISKLTRERIPNMIIETYKQMKEDWIYTYKIKGKFKTCIDCKNVYLATSKYFNVNKSKSSLRPECKECRRKRYKKRVNESDKK